MIRPKIPFKAILILFPAIFFCFASFITVGSSLFLLSKSQAARKIKEKITNPVLYTVFSSQPPILGATTQNFGTGDARGPIVEQFFAGHDAPLAPYGRFMVTMADKYGLPWNLLPAIAMKESNGGKKIPEGTNNPFGWAITSTETLGFLSWEEGIETVAKGLREKYFDQGLTTPELIMTKYCPLSVEKGGSWAADVIHFMEELETF